MGIWLQKHFHPFFKLNFNKKISNVGEISKERANEKNHVVSAVMHKCRVTLAFYSWHKCALNKKTLFLRSTKILFSSSRFIVFISISFWTANTVLASIHVALSLNPWRTTPRFIQAYIFSFTWIHIYMYKVTYIHISKFARFEVLLKCAPSDFLLTPS